ncbi:type IV secretory system conjugative DNA transfer family protein [Kribbella sp. NPDC051587]|uniref:type IV secretory system conjugative DNA transfer family protein n=1 Tax=Kribbella sp. NPDC051587 TaxID=3364119 RepID=UPI0037BA63EB
MPLLALALALAVGAIWFARYQEKASQTGKGGLATWRDLKPALSAKSAAEAARQRIPQLSGVTDISVCCVTFADYGNVALYIQHEDGVLVIGPPRSGKTLFFANPMTESAIGPVVVTSTKSDVLKATARSRLPKGTVWLFDLDGIAGSAAEGTRPLRWNPIIGCEDPEVASRRGAAWAAAQPMGNVKNGDWFNRKAGGVLSRLLCAAALGNRPVTDLLMWTNQLGSTEPVAILQRHGRHEWATALKSVGTSRAGESVDSIKLTLEDLLEPLNSPRVVEAMTATAEESFDPAQFLDTANSLYLIAAEGAEATAAPLFTMLVQEVMVAARMRSQQPATHPGGSGGGFLWPPLRCVLDEVANIAPLPSLPQHMADSGGRGIQLAVITQTFSQLKQRWGQEAAEAIRTTATTRVYLPGIDEQEIWNYLEARAGRKQVTQTSTSQSQQGTSTSTSKTWEPVLPASDVPQIPVGTAWMLYRNLPVTKVKLRLHHDDQIAQGTRR